MPQAEMLIQPAGSRHVWSDDRGPKFAPLLAVEDATGAVVNAVSCISENTAGYFTLLEGLIEGWGILLELYSDRRAIFKDNARQPETAAEVAEFARSLQELGIRHIFTRSPQSKGRMERAAGTFQDRLVTELRLADARTIHQGTTAYVERPVGARRYPVDHASNTPDPINWSKRSAIAPACGPRTRRPNSKFDSRP